MCKKLLIFTPTVQFYVLWFVGETSKDYACSRDNTLWPNTGLFVVVVVVVVVIRKRSSVLD
jgi:hypothetical protein